jgi:hypothetical protein
MTSTSIDIDRSAVAVYAYVTDPSRFPPIAITSPCFSSGYLNSTPRRCYCQESA